MENPEEILHSLEEFSKTKPKDIPRELEEYLSFVAKTGDPIYQWSSVKSLFREKMISVITDFYETCPSLEIPPCPNVDLFNYDVMKTFILEKLDTFAAAPFTLQRISELLTAPRKEYNRIDKYMRALEKNILVVSTTEPRSRRNTENGDGIVNGLESEHLPEISNSSNDINVEEMDDPPTWPRFSVSFSSNNSETPEVPVVQETVVTASKTPETACTSTQDTVICRNTDEPYVSIEPVPSTTCTRPDDADDVSVTITAIPAGVQKRRNSVEPVVSSESASDVTETKQEEETREVEDADSSSSTEDDKESVETPKLDDVSSQNELSSTESEESKSSEEVTTSELVEEKEEDKESEEAIVDTTKCSKPASPPPTSDVADEEITSSAEKIEEVIDSSVQEEIEEKVEEEHNEALSLASNEDCEKVEESQTKEEEVDKEIVSENEEIAMEVDEENL